MKDECTCQKCPECGGTGNIWISFSGKYLGRYRGDDLDELDICPECEGSGIISMCENCMDELLAEQEKKK